MIDKNTAEKLVTEYINAACNFDDGDTLVVVDEETIEKTYGWVFFYTSRFYLETGDDIYAVVGNGPTIVESKDGTLHILGTALPPD